MHWLATVVALHALLPDEALEPPDPSVRGRIEQISPGPCGAETASSLTHEGEGPSSIGHELPIDEVRGKHVQLLIRALSRGGAPPPSMWIEVMTGSPTVLFGRKDVAAAGHCEPMVVDLNVPTEATQVTVGVQLAQAGVLVVEPLKLKVLGDAPPVVWASMPARGSIGNWEWNEGALRKLAYHRFSRTSVAALVLKKSDTAWVNEEGPRAERVGANQWTLRLQRDEFTFSGTFVGGVLRVVGRGPAGPFQLELATDRLRVVTPGVDLDLSVKAGRQSRAACHDYEDDFSVIRVCGFVPNAQSVPQATLAAVLGLLVDP